MSEKFDIDYMKYWQKAVEKSIDGTFIANASICRAHLSELKINKSDKVLDLGCSFGRMYEAMATFSDHVFGVDVDYEVINQASQFNYRSLAKGAAESTPFPSNYFEYVISWAVFDVVDLPRALVECSRILKNNGTLFFTCKNENYLDDDKLGFIAERNSSLKGFPNRFTDLSSLVKNAPNFGFEVTALNLFLRRGDMGLNQFSRADLKQDIWSSYEYAITLKKIKDIESPEKLLNIKLYNTFSLQAIKRARSSNHQAILDFFKKNKEEHND